MDPWQSFDCVETIEFEVAACESFTEWTIAWIKFVREFMFSGQLRSWISTMITIIHIISPIDGWANFEPMGGILICCILFDRKLGSFFKLLFRGNSIFFKLLSNYLIFDESFCFFEVVHWIDNLWIGGHHLLFNIEFLCSDSILCPCYIQGYVPVPYYLLEVP